MGLTFRRKIGCIDDEGDEHAVGALECWSVALEQDTLGTVFLFSI